MTHTAKERCGNAASEGSASPLTNLNVLRWGMLHYGVAVRGVPGVDYAVLRCVMLSMVVYYGLWYGRVSRGCVMGVWYAGLRAHTFMYVSCTNESHSGSQKQRQPILRAQKRDASARSFESKADPNSTAASSQRVPLAANKLKLHLTPSPRCSPMTTCTTNLYRSRSCAAKRVP
jgi:hypothetical protein